MFIEPASVDASKAPPWALDASAVEHVAEFGFPLTHPVLSLIHI